MEVRGARGRLKRWLIPVALVGVIITGLLVIPYLININTYRSRITSQLEQRLGRSVTLGPLGLSLVPSVKFQAADVIISDDPQFAQGPFIQARSVRLKVGLWSLLRGNPQVRSIELTGPVVAPIKNKEGTWNWSTLRPLKEPGREVAPMHIVIHDGRFTIIDRTPSPPSEQTYTSVDADIKNFSSRTASEVKLAITMPGEEAGQLEMEGTVGPIDPENVPRSPIDARMKMRQVELAGLEALLGRASSRQGRLTLDADLKGRLAEGLRAKGEIRAEGLRLVEGTEPSDIPLDAEFDLTARTQGQSDYAVKIASGGLNLGETRITITGQANQIPTNSTVDLQVKGDGISLEGLLESAHAFGFGPPKGTLAKGQANINIHATGPVKAITLNGQSQMRDLRFQSRELPQPIHVSQLNLTFEPSAITASPFRTALGERTTVDIASLSIRDYSQQPRLHLQIATQNARIEDLIEIAKSFGYRPEISGTGATSLRATIETSSGESAGATTVTGQGTISGAHIRTPQLTQPLGIQGADLTFTGDSVRATNLRAQLGQSQIIGWVQVKNFDRPSAVFDLRFNQLIVSEFRQLIAVGEATSDHNDVIAKQYASLVPQAFAQTKRGSSGIANLSGGGQLAIGRVVFDDIMATDLRSKVTLRGKAIDLNPLEFGLYGGRFQGPLSLSLAGAEPGIALSGGFSGVDINQFLSAASSLKNVIYGRANAALNLRGRGRQFDSIIRSLTGQGRLTVAEGKITSFDLERQIALIGQLTGLRAGGAGTIFRQLNAILRFANGKLLTENLRLELGQIKVIADGALQLGAPVTTDYDLLAQLNEQLTQRILPGDHLVPVVGNFFMAGRSLVVPLKMSGPLGQPRFSLNAELLRRRVTERFRRQPGRVVEDILDIFKRKEKSKPKEEERKP
ncbi:MAG: AsmA family protein [Acidobacteria bacterium]|nr:AsmA family protein [Acidobacteriota bacterium]